MLHRSRSNPAFQRLPASRFASPRAGPGRAGYGSLPLAGTVAKESRNESRERGKRQKKKRGGPHRQTNQHRGIISILSLGRAVSRYHSPYVPQNGRGAGLVRITESWHCVMQPVAAPPFAHPDLAEPSHHAFSIQASSLRDKNRKRSGEPGAARGGWSDSHSSTPELGRSGVQQKQKRSKRFDHRNLARQASTDPLHFRPGLFSQLSWRDSRVDPRLIWPHYSFCPMAIQNSHIGGGVERDRRFFVLVIGEKTDAHSTKRFFSSWVGFFSLLGRTRAFPSERAQPTSGKRQAAAGWRSSSSNASGRAAPRNTLLLAGQLQLQLGALT